MQSHVFPRDLGKGMAKTATSFDDDNKEFRMTRLEVECGELYRQLLVERNWMKIWQPIADFYIYIYV